MLEIPPCILEIPENKGKEKKTLLNLIFSQQVPFLKGHVYRPLPKTCLATDFCARRQGTPCVNYVTFHRTSTSWIARVGKLTPLRWLMPFAAINTASHYRPVHHCLVYRLRSFLLRWKLSETEGSFKFYDEDAFNCYRWCDSPCFSIPWHRQRASKTRPNSWP